MRIVITGSSGSLARDVIPGLLNEGHDIHGLDRASAEGFAAQLERTTHSGAGQYTFQQLDLVSQRRQEVLGAFSGADAIIHLAGIPLEDSWANLARANVDATNLVCSVALESGVRRIVLASSIHAVGLTPIPSTGDRLQPTLPANPNTLYGVSKVAAEALGQYFAEQHGLEMAILRICSRMSEPITPRHLSTWLSPNDATRLCAAAVCGTLPARYWPVWGVSDNARSWFDMSSGYALGFTPQDNAEVYSGQVEEHGVEDLSATYTTIGGGFSTKNPPSMKKEAQV